MDGVESESDLTPDNPLDLTPGNPLDLSPDNPAKRRRKDSPEDDSAEEERPPSPKKSLPPIIGGCRGVECYKKLNKIDEGAYGVVWRAECKATKKIVALKQIKLEKFPDGFPKSSLREINILQCIRHQNIVTVQEMVVGNGMDQIFMVMEYMEHELKTLLWDMAEGKRAHFSIAEVKSLLYQLLDAVDYLHENFILHRDIKSSNILFNNLGVLKVCDFGLARYIGDPLPSTATQRVSPLTTVVVTLWYRAPELLLADPNRVITYGPAVDVWSCGCIFGEMLALKPIFMGERNEIDHLVHIFNVTGAPNEESWPGVTKMHLWSKLSSNPQFVPHKRPKWEEKFDARSLMNRGLTLSPHGLDLAKSLLSVNPANRMPCGDAKVHAWFAEAPQPVSLDALPKWKDSNAEAHAARRCIRSDERFKTSAADGHAAQAMGVCVNPKRYLQELDEKGKTLPGPSGPIPVPAEREPLPAGWVERKSNSTGKAYFINVKTKETTWNRPTKPAF